MAGRFTYDSNPLRTAALKTIQKQHNTTDKTEYHEKTPSEEVYDWRDDANCAGLNHHMFPRSHKDISYITQARQICRECDVKEECLTDALQWPATDMNGVWAGLTPRQLAQKQKDLGIIPTRPTVAQIWNEITKKEQNEQSTF